MNLDTFHQYMKLLAIRMEAGRMRKNLYLRVVDVLIRWKNNKNVP